MSGDQSWKRRRRLRTQATHEKKIKLIIERLCYKPAAYEVMSVSKFTIEISKYIVIDKTNLNRKRNFRISSTNIAIYNTTRRIIFV